MAKKKQKKQEPLTPEQLKENERLATARIEDARIRAVGQSPNYSSNSKPNCDQVFFAHCALQLEPVMTRSIPTMATDSRKLYYNPEFTLSLSEDEVYGVAIGHETMHCAMNHFFRGRNQESKTLQNICQDLEINIICREAGYVLPSMALFPGEGQFSSLPTDETFENYYDMIMKDPEKYNIKITEIGEDEDLGGCGTAIQSGDEAKQAEDERRWKEIVASAAQSVQRMKGTVSAGVQRFVDSILKPKYDPWLVLEQRMTRTAKNDISWARCDRRSLARGSYLPSKHSLALGEVVIMMDLSGSITEEQARMMGWVMNTCLARTPGRLVVMYHDVDVHRVQEWNPGDPELKFEPCGGGGTSHLPAFKKIVEMGLSPDLILCVTDMYSEFPENCEHDTVWLPTVESDIRAPFGEHISLV